MTWLRRLFYRKAVAPMDKQTVLANAVVAHIQQATDA